MATGDPPPHEIIIVPDVGQPGREELRDQCYALRITVFHHEQKFPLETEIDECVPSSIFPALTIYVRSSNSRLDEIATHILLRLVPSHEPIGTIRCTKNTSAPDPRDHYYKLSRLVVLKQYRQHRLGAVLVRALHEYVRQDASKSLRSESVVSATVTNKSSTSRPDCHAQEQEQGPQERTHVRVVCHSQLYAKGFYAR